VVALSSLLRRRAGSLALVAERGIVSSLMTYPYPNPLHSRDPRGIPHDAAFRVCLHDLERLLEYVELHRDNLAVFSHRTYELFLRVATEFEATCKSLLVSGPSKPDIRDFEVLSSRLNLPAFGVGFMTGSADPIILEPFKDWSVPGTPLSWYQSYNDVKHNRATAFSDASLQNLLLAVGGLFILLAQGFKPPLFLPSNSTIDRDTRRFTAYFEEFPLFLEGSV
jgi:hypothetical protein